MFGPAAVLDDDGSATEASGLQNFLQWIPNPYVFERENSDRNAPIQRNRYQIVSLAETVSWSIPDANRGMSTNSPGTGSKVHIKAFAPDRDRTVFTEVHRVWHVIIQISNISLQNTEIDESGIFYHCVVLSVWRRD